MRPWLFLTPSLTGIAIFVLIPSANMVVCSFFQAVGRQFAGMENFIQVFYSQAFRLAVKNTLYFILAHISVLMAFSLWTAVLVTATADSRNLYKATLLLPTAIPVTSVVLLQKLLLHPQGLPDQLVVRVDGRGQGWLSQGSAFYVLTLTYIWKNTGCDMMLRLAGPDGIPKELFEAAKVDGAGSWQSFFHMALPGSRSTAFLALTLSTVNSFKVSREAYLISGNYPHESIYMLQRLLNHWSVSLDIQEMSVASTMVETSILISVLLWTWKRKKR